MLSFSTTTRTELPGLEIQDATFSGVLLASHRPRISGSFRWSAPHNSEIDRLITSQAAAASSGTASRISISIPPERGYSDSKHRLRVEFGDRKWLATTL